MLSDKVSGILMGLAVGDALGVPHEFRNQKNNIYTGLLYIKPKYVFRFATREDSIGQYSDDTEMTLYNMRSVIKNYGYKRDSIILAYQEWANTSKAIGKNTRYLFKGVKTINGFEKRWKKKFENSQEKENCQSNGALMRCSMLALLCDDNMLIQDVNLTNPNQICIDAELLYAECIRNTVIGKSTDEILDELINKDYCAPVLQVLEEICNGTKRDIKQKGKGWVLHTLYCALWAWYYYDSFQEGIDYIIRLGGDTDTNGAVAGALLGAKLGFKHMCKEERTKQNIEIIRNTDLSQGDYPRPPECLLNDFDELIQDYTKIINKHFN